MHFLGGKQPSGAQLVGGAHAALSMIQGGQAAEGATLQGGDLGAALSFKCVADYCYSYQSPETDAKFKELQQTINRLAGVVGFSPLKIDGLIGASTQGALIKVGQWVAKQPNGEVQALKGSRIIDEAQQGFKAVAAAATGWTGMMEIIADAAPRASTPAPSSAPRAPAPAPTPALAPFPAPAQKAPLLARYPWLPYVAAGLGGFAILAVAYKLSSRPLAPAAAGVSGARKRRS